METQAALERCGEQRLGGTRTEGSMVRNGSTKRRLEECNPEEGASKIRRSGKKRRSENQRIQMSELRDEMQIAQRTDHSHGEEAPKCL